MLQRTYSIYSDDMEDAMLFIEAGKNHIACWCKKKDDNKLRAFEFFRCDDYSAETLEDLIDHTRSYSKLLTMPVNSTSFFWNTDEVLCLPREKKDEVFVQSNFDLLFGNTANSKIFCEQTDECLVSWRIDNQQQDIIQQSFRGATFSHQFIPLLSSSVTENRNAFYLFFYPQYFTFLAFKENRLHFAQTRKYNTPEDVLYFVLNVCTQYGIDKNVDIFCGGFIDENSKLYETLYQYLEGLQLMKVNDEMLAAEGFKEFSSHYFMPYVNYAV